MYMIIFLILSLWIHSFAFAYITPYKTFNRLRVTKLLKLWPKENSHQKTATTSNSVSNLKNMQLYFKTDEDDEEWEDISAPTINKDSSSSLSGVRTSNLCRQSSEKNMENHYLRLSRAFKFRFFLFFLIFLLSKS